jgi:murein biosynthesis integral membrane protein MurJ
MLGAAFWLTLATLTGLAAGFAREWLLIAAWGAGTQSDAFLVAIFLPEALRVMLAGGILSAAALPLYQKRHADAQREWLVVLTPQLLLAGLFLSMLLAFFAPWIILATGPGLSAAAGQTATHSLRLLAWCIPGFLMYALFAVPLQAQERFTRVGLGSLFFNLPPVIYLLVAGKNSLPAGVALACLTGSLMMPLALLPPLHRHDWRGWRRRCSIQEIMELARSMGALLASAAASQGVLLLERMAASFLGEGAVTWVNLARKLVNLPLVALMSLNQVLLALMSGKEGMARLALLKRGLDCATLLTLPTALAIVGAAPALTHFLLPPKVETKALAFLLAWFSVPLVFGAWNAMLARYSYADGNTRSPLWCELSGNAANVLLLFALPFLIGLAGIAFAALGGILVTGLLLMRRQNLLHELPWKRQWGIALFLLAGVGLLYFPLAHPGLQLALSAATAILALVGCAFWLKPWRALPETAPAQK